MNLTEIECPICHEKEWAFHAAYERKLIIQGHNKKKNYVQMTEKKLYKMQYIIKKKMLPEIEEEIKQWGTLTVS